MSTLPFPSLAPAPPRDPAQVAAETAIAEAVAAHVPPLLEALREHRAALSGEERLAEAIRHTIARLEALSAREFPGPPAPVTASELAADLARRVKQTASSRADQLLADAVALLGLPPMSAITAADSLNAAGLAITDARFARDLTLDEQGAAFVLRMAQGATQQLRGYERANLNAIDALRATEDLDGLRAFTPVWP